MALVRNVSLNNLRNRIMKARELMKCKLRIPLAVCIFTKNKLMIAMIEAGSETTSSTLNSCLLYLCANPEVQKVTQQELDTVLQGRSPTFDDEGQLPYCRSIVKEILR